MVDMSHDHEIKHLNKIDRRKFLKTTTVLSGAALLGNLIEMTDASALTPSFGEPEFHLIRLNSTYFL